MFNFLWQIIQQAIEYWSQKKVPQQAVQPVAVQPVLVPPPTTEPNPMPTTLQWDTQENTRHAIRVRCDNAGLTFEAKNDITACIYQESSFWNILPNGKPTTHENRNDAGVLTSTDWGLCQINDTKGWYIGPPPLPFASVPYLLSNPQKAVDFMIEMYKQGQLSKWVSYSSGAYKKWLPFVASPVPVSGSYV